MVKIDDFHVEFLEKWSLYHPGETVNGQIHLKLNDKIFCDSISVLFYGSARVFWVEREPQGSVTYSSENVYFNEKHEVWSYPLTTKELQNKNQTAHENRAHLPAGKHVLDFSYTLPNELPTSFDAKHSSGYVRYFVKILVTNEEMIRHSRKAFFTVVKPEDLNFHPALSVESSRQHIKQCKSSSCFPSNPNRRISMNVRLAKQGYVPGEQIKFSAEIENSSGRSVHAMKAHLVQYVSAYANSPTFKMQDSFKVIVSVGKKDKLPKGSTTLWNDTLLYVPAVVPTFVINDVLEVHYSLRVEAYCDKHGSEVTVDVPLTIGTVPLIGSNNNDVTSIPRCVEPPPAYDNFSMSIRKWHLSEV